MTTVTHSTTRDAELIALRDAIYANRTRADITLRDCAEEAIATLAGLLDYAAAWDQDADAALLACYWPAVDSIEEVTPEPTPPTTPAGRKAAYQLARGLDLVRAAGGYLVPSGTRGSVVHFVSDTGACSCEAGLHGRPCWHVEAVAQQARKQAA
jgi:hypothetical protein